MHIILSLLLWFAGPAHADIQSFVVIPLGDREALLGNAGVALEHSTGGMFYNPAGLAGIEKSRLSASGTTYAVVEATSDTASGPLSFREISAVPNMLVSSRKVGQWTLAFGILVPVVLQVNAYFEAAFPLTNGTTSIAFTSRQEENYIGVSAARTLSKYWDAGLSLFLHRYSESSLSSNQVRPNGGAGVEAALSQQKDIETMDLVAVLGVQNRVTPNLRWGARLQGESYQIRGKAKIYEEVFVANGGSTNRSLIKDDYDANNRLPFDLLSGIDWQFAPKHNLVADLGLNAPMSVHTVPNTKFNQAVRTRSKLRGNIGYAYTISDHWKAMTGLEWAPSQIDRVSTTDSPVARQNWFGGTLGVYNQSGNVSTGVGAYYMTARVNTDFFGRTPDDRTGFRLWGVVISTSLDY